MIQTSPLLIVPRDCEFVVGRLTQRLALGGYNAERSFDLQRVQTEPATCACPHHGTAKCNCQMIVLLVYFPSGVMRTMIAHGCDGITHLDWSEELTIQEQEGLGEIIKDLDAELHLPLKSDIPART